MVFFAGGFKLRSLPSERRKEGRKEREGERQIAESHFINSSLNGRATFPFPSSISGAAAGAISISVSEPPKPGSVAIPETAANL